MSRRSIAATVGALVLSLALSACGGDSSSDDETGDAQTSTPAVSDAQASTPLSLIHI